MVPHGADCSFCNAKLSMQKQVLRAQVLRRALPREIRETGASPALFGLRPGIKPRAVPAAGLCDAGMRD